MRADSTGFAPDALVSDLAFELTSVSRSRLRPVETSAIAKASLLANTQETGQTGIQTDANVPAGEQVKGVEEELEGSCTLGIHGPSAH